MAMDREMEREEMRKLESEEQRIADEEAEQRRQQKREEALARRKAREEKQAKQREAEEENWEKAMSGELTGRRKAAIVSAKNVSTVNAFADTVLVEERNELTTAMYKTMLRPRSDGTGSDSPTNWDRSSPAVCSAMPVPMWTLTKVPTA